MSQVIEVTGNTVRACCATARRRLGLKLQDSRERIRSGGEDGLYRVHLTDGTIVEATILKGVRNANTDTTNG